MRLCLHGQWSHGGGRVKDKEERRWVPAVGERLCYLLLVLLECRQQEETVNQVLQDGEMNLTFRRIFSQKMWEEWHELLVTE